MSSVHHQHQPPATNHGRAGKPQQNPNQPPPPQKCPRCDSANTKFCYYNNYSLSQPRYFCKACRRYWTHGGTLRNIPVGGGCRKGKRPKLSPPTSAAHHEMIPSPPAAFSPSSQTLRAPANPLMMRGGGMPNNLYSDSSADGGGFFSSVGGMVRSQPLQGGVAGGYYGGQLGGNVALLQGMSYHHQQPRMQVQQRAPPPLGSWTQGFIIGTGAAAQGPSVAPTTTSFWSGANFGEDQGKCE